MISPSIRDRVSISPLAAPPVSGAPHGDGARERDVLPGHGTVHAYPREERLVGRKLELERRAPAAHAEDDRDRDRAGGGGLAVAERIAQRLRGRVGEEDEGLVANDAAEELGEIGALDERRSRRPGEIAHDVGERHKHREVTSVGRARVGPVQDVPGLLRPALQADRKAGTGEPQDLGERLASSHSKSM